MIRTEILPNIKRGLSASVLTQTSDVEEEVNGLMTYDRRITKINPDIDPNMVRGINDQ